MAINYVPITSPTGAVLDVSPGSSTYFSIPNWSPSGANEYEVPASQATLQANQFPSVVGWNNGSPILQPYSNAPYVPPEVQALQQLAQIDPGVYGPNGLLNTVENTYNNTLIPEAVSQAQLGTSMTPDQIREIDQAIRGNQVAAGNLPSSPAQAAAQASSIGQAGLNLQQQRQAYLQNVLQQAQGYITGGATPYGQGASYVNNALNQEAQALTGAQIGGPTYATTQTAPYVAPSYLNPNAGTQFAQGARDFYQAGVGATPGSPDTSGQTAGSAIGAVGSIVGAVLPLLFCWVAREIFGGANPKWLIFRNWLLCSAPEWILRLYAQHGEKAAKWLKKSKRPVTRTILKFLMEQAIS